MPYNFNIFTGTFDYYKSLAIGGVVTGGTEGSVLFLGVGGILAQDNANFFWDNANNRLGLGTATPGYPLDISDGTIAINIGADNLGITRTNATAKIGRFTIPHYTNAEQPMAIFNASSDSSDNTLDLGGGSGLMNAATRIIFWTAADNTSTTGTQRMGISSGGLVNIGTTSTADAMLEITTNADAETALHLKEKASQTGDMMTVTNSSDTPYVTIGPSALTGSSTTSNFFNVTGTLTAVTSALSYGANILITSAGTSANTQVALNVELLAGYTGAANTQVARIINVAAGTNGGALALQRGNLGFNAGSRGTTTGDNIGLIGQAQGGDRSVGVLGVATTDKASAANVGVLGVARNTGGGGTQIGGFFGLFTSTDPTLITGALVASNGATTAPIFLARDDNTTVFSIVDGGATTLTSTLTLSPITAGSVLFAGTAGVVSQDNANLFYDNSNNRLGVGTAAPVSTFHTASDSNNIFTIETFSDTTSTRSYIRTKRRKGTIASPGGAPDDGTALGQFEFQGWDGANYLTGALVRGMVNGTPSTSNMPAELQFWTNSGAGSATQKSVLTKAGLWGINEVAPDSMLEIGTTGTTVRALKVKETASQTANMFEATTSGDTPYVTIGPSTLTGSSITSNFFNVTGTLPAVPSTTVFGTYINITSAGSASQVQEAMVVKLGPGYTGSSTTVCLNFTNVAAGTGINYGMIGQTTPTTTGTNIGSLGLASKGNLNIGQFGYAIVDKASAQNVGVMGFALNGGATSEHVAGWFELATDTTSPTINVSAALVADNGTQDDPIFLGRHNGTTAVTIDSVGRLNTQAGRLKNITRVTTTYTILVSDEEVFGNTDSAGYTATLPAGVQDQHFRIVNTGSSGNILTTAPNGSEHLLGVNSNWALNDGESLILTYDATDGWY